jgi:flagellin-like hook-associated protein FlgL
LVRGANGTNTDAERNIIATEVDELLEHLVSIANSNIGGRHIFAGQKTLEKPFTYDKSTRTITYKNPELWWDKAIVNIANAGMFSSDRTVLEYNDKIWHVPKVK